MLQKLIHVVGGGFNQVPLVKRAKSRGMRVLVTDFYENPPAKEFADFFEQIDTTDRASTLECSKKHKIDFVTTDMTDVAVPTVAYIAETLGLPGIGYETSIRFTNKYVMRKSLQPNLSAYIPESHFFELAKDALAFGRQIRTDQTFLVKPVNSQGSKGVYILPGNQPAKLETHINAAFLESRNRGVLIERYVEGFEYSVETFVNSGTVHNLTLTKKYHYAHNPCLDERNTFLGDVDKELENKLFSANEKIIKELGLPFGMTHAEYKIENGQVYLMEIAARGAGGSISSHIVPYLTGFDTLDGLLSVYTNEPFEVKTHDYKQRFAILKFFSFAPGKIAHFVLNEDLLRKSLIYTLELKQGQQIVLPRDSRDRPGYFVVHGENRQDVLNLEKAMETSVQIDYA